MIPPNTSTMNLSLLQTPMVYMYMYESIQILGFHNLFQELLGGTV